MTSTAELISPEEPGDGLPRVNLVLSESDEPNSNRESQEDIFDPIDFLSTLVDKVVAEVPYAESSSFSFGPNNFVGNEVVQASQITRFKSIISAVRMVAPDAIHLNPDKRKKERTPYIALGNTNKYLDKAVKVNSVEISRQGLVPIPEVLDLLTAALRVRNDPIVQALDVVETQFSNTIPQPELRELRYDVMKATKRDHIEAVVDGFIKKFKDLAAELETTVDTSVPIADY